MINNDTISENDSISSEYSLNFSTELVTNTNFLIGYNVYSKVLTIWNKHNYELVSKITTTPIEENDNNLFVEVSFFIFYTL